MKEVVGGKKSLKITFWNLREGATIKSATTIIDMSGKAEIKSRSIHEFISRLPEVKRMAVKEIPGFTFTKNHKHLPQGREAIQELADVVGLPVEVYRSERGYHEMPEFQFRVDPR